MIIIKQDASVRKKLDSENRFLSIFNSENGSYLRTGIIENGKDTGVNPFMTDYPELLDLGIMGRCKNAHLCDVGCYQGKKSEGENMSLEDYKTIIDQFHGKVFQVALGGAGSPDEHENFEEILKYTRDSGVIPNYTTSGIGVDERIAQLTKQYCGAVAVSFYRKEYTYRAIDLFLQAGCKTNIHYVLSEDSIEEATNRLKRNAFPAGINAIIFLMHKPVGCGSDKLVLRDEQKIKNFFKVAMDKHPFKIGFDSCSVPGILNYAKESVLVDSVDTCEGGRFSCYIGADMVMVPCSFDQQRKYGVSLRGKTVEEAWNSDEFKAFRNKLVEACPQCPNHSECMGGCPLEPSIVLCTSKERMII